MVLIQSLCRWISAVAVVVDVVLFVGMLRWGWRVDESNATERNADRWRVMGEGRGGRRRICG